MPEDIRYVDNRFQHQQQQQQQQQQHIHRHHHHVHGFKRLVRFFSQILFVRCKQENVVVN